MTEYEKPLTANTNVITTKGDLSYEYRQSGGMYIPGVSGLRWCLGDSTQTVRIPLHCAVCACLDDAAAGNMARYARVHKQQYKGRKPLCPGFCEECKECGISRQTIRMAVWLRGWEVAE